MAWKQLRERSAKCKMTQQGEGRERGSAQDIEIILATHCWAGAHLLLIKVLFLYAHMHSSTLITRVSTVIILDIVISLSVDYSKHFLSF